MEILLVILILATAGYMAVATSEIEFKFKIPEEPYAGQKGYGNPTPKMTTMDYRLKRKNQIPKKEKRDKSLEKGDKVQVYTLHNDFEGTPAHEKELTKTGEGVVIFPPGSRRATVQLKEGPQVRRSKTNLEHI